MITMQTTRKLTAAETAYIVKLSRKAPDGYRAHDKTVHGLQVRGLIANNPAPAVRIDDADGKFVGWVRRHAHVLTTAGVAAADAIADAEVAGEVERYEARLVLEGKWHLLSERF